MDIRLVWLALGAFAGSVESSLIVAVLPAIASETGVSMSQVGWIVTLYALAYGFGTPIVSTLLGKVDRRTVVASAEFVFGCMAIALGLLPHFLMLVIVRACLAVGAGTFTSTAQATAVALSDAGRRGRAVAIVATGGSIGVAVGVPFAVWAAQTFGWRSAYLGLGLLAVLAAFTMWRRLPGDIPGDRRSLRERLSVMRIRGVKRALVTTAFTAAATSVLLTYMAPVTTELMGLASNLLPIVFLAFGLGAVCGTGVGGWLTDRYGGRQTMLVMIGLLIVEIVALPLIAQLPRPLVLPGFLLDVAVLGTCFWGLSSPQINRLAALAPQSVPLAAALNLTTMNIGIAIAAMAGGWLLEHYGAATVCFASALAAVCALILASVVPDRAAAA